MASVFLPPTLRVHVDIMERIRSSNTPAYLFIYLFIISLNKHLLKLNHSFTQETSFPLGSPYLNLAEILSMCSTRREDGIFKISLLRLKHVVSVCSSAICTCVCNSVYVCVGRFPSVCGPEGTHS